VQFLRARPASVVLKDEPGRVVHRAPLIFARGETVARCGLRGLTRARRGHAGRAPMFELKGKK
jgi:hypothetical protein